MRRGQGDLRLKFLAIDTSSKRLAVAAKGDRTVLTELPDCAAQHSVLLMDEIGSTLKKAGLTLTDCDFFACVVGPGSFTGVRIGVSTVKGLCAALDRPALALTSFDCLAYAEKSGGKILALVDAGHGCYYACGYEGRKAVLPARYLSAEEAESLIAEGFAPVSAENLPIGAKTVPAGEGLPIAAEALADRAAPCADLEALYLRRSSAEERR